MRRQDALLVGTRLPGAAPRRRRPRLLAGIAALIVASAIVAVLAYRAGPLSHRVALLRTYLQERGHEQVVAIDPHVRGLLDAMGDPRTEEGIAARADLTKLGKPVVPLLIRRLSHADAQTRAAAALTLGNLADPRAVGPLCRALADPDAMVRYRAAYALGRLGDPRAVPSLSPLLQDPSPDVADVVMRALEEGR
jgi:hypothetical protein